MKPIILVIIDNPSDKLYFTSLNKKYSFIFYQLSLVTNPHKQASIILTELNKQSLIIDGVFGGRDFPSILASLIAEKLKLPGLHPEALYKAQHKAIFAEIALRVNADYPPTIIISNPKQKDPNILFPSFIKPARGHISMNSYIIPSYSDLQVILPELFVRKNKVEDWFNLFYKKYKKETHPPVHSFLLQPFIDARQYTLDGFVTNNRVHMLGVTESIFTSDKKSFDRFEFPAVLSPNVSTLLREIVEKLLKEIEFNNSGFNIEFFVTTDDKIILIELNTRLALQFVPLFNQWYEQSNIDILLQVCLGKNPDLSLRKIRRMATNFVFRSKKDQLVISLPDPKEIQKLKKEGVIEYFHSYVKAGDLLSQYDNDAYSYRYAVIDIAGKTNDEIGEKYQIAKNHLRYDFQEASILTQDNLQKLKKQILANALPLFTYDL